MEQNFYNDDFEQFLKETADEFRMYPSKRVWNSLYNDLHPSRKWPSLAVCLLLISSVVFIGVAHKNEITGSVSLVKKDATPTQIAALNNKGNINSQNTLLAAAPKISQEAQDVHDQQTLPGTSIAITPASRQSNTTQTSHTVTGQGSPLVSNNQTAIVQRNAGNSSTATIGLVDNTNSNTSFEQPTTTNEPVSLAVGINENGTNNSNNEERFEDPTLTKSNLAIASAGITAPVVTLASIKAPLIPFAKNGKTTEEREWIEDYAFHNQPEPSLRSKLLSQLYITPSIGYRSFNKNVSYDIPSRNTLNSLMANPPQENPKTVYHDPAFNLEIGYNVLFPHTKSVRFKAGAQLNYTNYIVHAQNLGHTTTTTLLLNDPYSGGIELEERPSSLANNPKEFNEKLNNYAIELSLPFGADVKIAGKHNLQWFAGATLQPTYVLFGNAYLISSDMKNYVYDSKFLRKWNLNGGIETFLSYKTKNGVVFNAGPSFRYQFFSNYDKSFSYDEHRSNFGLKIGMIRNF